MSFNPNRRPEMFPKKEGRARISSALKEPLEPKPTLWERFCGLWWTWILPGVMVQLWVLFTSEKAWKTRPYGSGDGIVFLMFLFFFCLMYWLPLHHWMRRFAPYIDGWGDIRGRLRAGDNEAGCFGWSLRVAAFLLIYLLAWGIWQSPKF